MFSHSGSPHPATRHPQDRDDVLLAVPRRDTFCRRQSTECDSFPNRRKKRTRRSVYKVASNKRGRINRFWVNCPFRASQRRRAPGAVCQQIGSVAASSALCAALFSSLERIERQTFFFFTFFFPSTADSHNHFIVKVTADGRVCSGRLHRSASTAVCAT